MQVKPITGHIHGSPQHIEACIGAGNHDLAKATPSIWASLPLVGRVEYRGRAAEIRNCECTSSLAIRIAS